MADAKYVRLADRLSSQGIADLETGWSISGLDVKEVPEGTSRKVVKRWVQTGILEPASQAEYDEVQEALTADNDGAQEHVVQNAGAAVRAKIKETRAANAAAEEDGEDDDEVFTAPPPPVSADGAPERLSPAASTTRKAPRGRGAGGKTT